MTAPRLLVVDDESQLVRVLEASFSAEGYAVECAGAGQQALHALEGAHFDAMILDLGLPDLDGKDVITRVRENSSIPIIVLSARDAEQEKVAALDLGANDFVDKPFNMGELMARVRVALRQSRAPLRSVERIGYLEIDFEARRMKVRGQEIRPSPRELKLLRAFIERLDEVLTHKQIVTSVWGADEEVEPQFVRVLVANLRQKIEIEPSRPRIIVTEAGVGYRMRAPQTKVVEG